MRRLFAAIATLLSASCQTLSTDVPARIVAADNASRVALKETVTQAVGTEVMLADDALVNSSILTIERNPPRTMQNPNPQGRAMDLPIRLQLMKNGRDCVLVDQRNQNRYLLDGLDCEAE